MNVFLQANLVHFLYTKGPVRPVYRISMSQKSKTHTHSKKLKNKLSSWVKQADFEVMENLAPEKLASVFQESYIS